MEMSKIDIDTNEPASNYVVTGKEFSEKIISSYLWQSRTIANLMGSKFTSGDE